ncbi:hypothetical protein [Ectothiorhodospira sp. BSL-9]|uniref:hypothetical protein n=1 Tax=Ectothiorhodospira sp. BSL-9 TaxID=1442136 RepID=UPI001969DDAE|nr:hypothetical protein [Ectothiorhodospira sp. BSL-9]
MYREHFGLTQDPLGKQSRALFDTEPLRLLKQRFDWLLEHPGVGLLTGPRESARPPPCAN